MRRRTQCGLSTQDGRRGSAGRRGGQQAEAGAIGSPPTLDGEIAEAAQGVAGGNATQGGATGAGLRLVGRLVPQESQRASAGLDALEEQPTLVLGDRGASLPDVIRSGAVEALGAVDFVVDLERLLEILGEPHGGTIIEQRGFVGEDPQGAVAPFTGAVVLRSTGRREQGRNSPPAEQVGSGFGDERRAVVRLENQRRSPLLEQALQRGAGDGGGLALERLPQELIPARQVADGQHGWRHSIDRRGWLQEVDGPDRAGQVPGQTRRLLVLSPANHAAISRQDSCQLGAGDTGELSAERCQRQAGAGLAEHRQDLSANFQRGTAGRPTALPAAVVVGADSTAPRAERTG